MSLKQFARLDIAQDDLNLMLGGNAARIYRLPVPHTRLFRPVAGDTSRKPEAPDSIAPTCR